MDVGIFCWSNGVSGNEILVSTVVLLYRIRYFGRSHTVFFDATSMAYLRQLTDVRIVLRETFDVF